MNVQLRLWPVQKCRAIPAPVIHDRVERGEMEPAPAPAFGEGIGFHP
jgi:hypothetical protein